MLSDLIRLLKIGNRKRSQGGIINLRNILILVKAPREQHEALAARSQWDDGLTPSHGIRCQ
jgi:hypothetical protein